MWRWFRTLLESLHTPPEPLLLNMDETAVRFYAPPKAGFCIARKDLRTEGVREPRRPCTASTKRKAVTLVATICNDPEVQPELPQWILASRHTVPAHALREPRARNVRVRVNTSAWMNEDVMVSFIHDLGATCQRVAPGRRYILLLDALRSHYSTRVLATAAMYGLHIVIVPASCTFFLQPLDTDAFACLKRVLRAFMQRALRERRSDDVPFAVILEGVESAIRQVLQGKKWANVFRKNGFSRESSFLGRSVLQELGWEAPPDLEEGLPAFQDWEAMFPRGASIPFEALFRPLASLYPVAQAHACLCFQDPDPELLLGAIHDLVGEPRAPDLPESLGHAGPLTRSQSLLRDSLGH